MWFSHSQFLLALNVIAQVLIPLSLHRIVSVVAVRSGTTYVVTTKAFAEQKKYGHKKNALQPRYALVHLFGNTNALQNVEYKRVACYG